MLPGGASLCKGISSTSCPLVMAKECGSDRRPEKIRQISAINDFVLISFFFKSMNNLILNKRTSLNGYKIYVTEQMVGICSSHCITICYKKRWAYGGFHKTQKISDLDSCDKQTGQNAFPLRKKRYLCRYEIQYASIEFRMFFITSFSLLLLKCKL